MEQLGDYRLRKRLAVGGMGEVYLGEKVGPEGFVKPVVLKCVLPQLAKDRAFVQLFLDEARLAALLNHPNIAQVYDFGLVDGIYYIAMEYVAGYTVDDIRRKLRSIRQFMPLQHIANIASQVCQGLQYAHALTDARGESLGLVHRDVSPHNLIVSVDGSVKIVDFGIAKARAGLTRVQAKGAVGKFGYMSPEQSRGEVVDGRSDVFSLGICLWELTTNERLHDANLERAPEYSPARPIRGVEPLRPEVPRQFTQILETALSVEPADRYPSAQAMHLALERFQAAMTHYAGQSALAGYIKDLVDGKVERRGSDPAPSGGVVQPAEARSRSGGQVNMDAAQKYEEVFGVTVESKRARPQLRNVPSSWETRAPPPAKPAESAGSSTQSSSGARMLELDLPQDRAPELELRGSQPVFRSTPPAARGRSRTRWGLLLGVILVLGGLGAAVAFLQEPLHGAWQGLMGVFASDGSPGDAKLSSIVRFQSRPDGSELWLDGSRLGKTPIEVELLPGVDYAVELRNPGWATVRRTVTGKVGRGTQVLEMTLEKGATVRVETQPRGARVSVDGRRVSGRTTPTSLAVPAGRPVQVRVELDGGTAAARTVRAGPGEQVRLRFDLKASTQ
ncbi:MAG TPA: serine/threonine-protein kinase [Myxococcales bacterium LLY-WYZ-16_1]|nr:serine/threonine-protein kinase [Myxococcales bacterium LLY-WYZ-16_1]